MPSTPNPPLLLWPWTPIPVLLRPETPAPSPVDLPYTPAPLVLVPSTAIPLSLTWPITPPLMVTAAPDWEIIELPKWLLLVQIGIVPAVPLPVTVCACTEATANSANATHDANNDIVFMDAFPF